MEGCLNLFSELGQGNYRGSSPFTYVTFLLNFALVTKPKTLSQHRLKPTSCPKIPLILNFILLNYVADHILNTQINDFPPLILLI